MMFSKAKKRMELSRKINSLLMNAPGNNMANQMDDLQKAQRDAIAAAAAFLLTFPPPMNAETTQKSEQKSSERSADHQMPLANSPSQPISQRGNHWVHLGSFRNEEEMQRVKNKERVSKRRTEQLKNGVKVRYRCNTWKRTKCGFQMFTFATTNTGIIDLYESGEHDHSGRRKLEYDLYGPIRRRNNQNNQGKGELDEEISGGRNSNLASEIGEGSVERRLQETPSTSSEPNGSTFSLADADKNEKLLEMATKFGLTMTVENGNIYSVFYNGQIVLNLVESAESISVIGKEGEQRWIKADWAQFLWAILGRFAFLTKCLNDEK